MTDIFAAKLDSGGNWIWAVRAGGTGSDYGHDIDYDNWGNAILTGVFAGTAYFGTLTLTSNGGGSYDIFVAKLDSSGNWLWAVRAGGEGIWDYGNAVKTDYLGNVYLAGHFVDTADFGPFTLTSSGERDIFVAKLDPSGNWLWVQSAGGEQRDEGYALAVDNDCNVFLSGNFRETAGFGSFTLTSSGGEDIFAAKLDPDGEWLWAVNGGGTGYDYSESIDADAYGNVALTGSFDGTASFGPLTLTSSGSSDILVAKLDPDGEWLWAVRAGGTGSDHGFGIGVDAVDMIGFGGYFNGSAGFGPHTLTSAGLRDIFVAQMSDMLMANDLAAVSIIGPTSPTAGTVSEYTITVTINGINAQNNYTVRLLLNGYVTVGSVPGLELQPQQSLNYVVTWVPANPGPAFLNGQVVLTGDQIPFNDQTPNLDVVVQAAPGTLMVIVNDPQYQPIADACVACGSQSGSTDAGGVCVLQLAPGSYEVTASHPDYGSATQNVEIVSNQMSMLEFFLSPVAADDPVTPVTQTALLGNCPNPFSSGTAILYSLKEAGPVSISIHNLKGERVTMLINETMNPGRYSVAWNGRDKEGRPVAGGLYLVRLQTQKATMVNKLVVLK